MEELTPKTVEETIFNVLATVTHSDTSAFTMDTSIEDINLKSIELISISALLEEKLGVAPKFRTLSGMKALSEIRDYIVRNL